MASAETSEQDGGGDITPLEICAADQYTSEGIKVSYRIVTIPECEIAKNNRLTLLMDIHRQRQATEKPQETEVEMVKGKAAGCESCGKIKLNVSSCSGHLVCSSCAALYGAINHRLPVVASAAKRLGKVEELVGLLGGAPLAVAVESDALERIAALVGYAGTNGEGLIEALERLIGDNMEERGRHACFLVELRDILKQPVGPVDDLIDAIRALDVKVTDQLLLDAIGPPTTRPNCDAIRQAFGVTDPRCNLVSGISEMASALDQYRLLVDRYSAEKNTLADRVSELEQAAVSSSLLNMFIDQAADDLGFHEALDEARGNELNFRNVWLSNIMRVAGDIASMRGYVRRVETLEQDAIVNEQIFARLRELLDADGLANGELPSVLGSLLHEGLVNAGVRLNKRFNAQFDTQPDTTMVAGTVEQLECWSTLDPVRDALVDFALGALSGRITLVHQEVV